MGILDRVRSIFAPRSYSYAITPAGLVDVANYSIDRLYRTQPNLRAVVTFLSDNAAQVPWKVYDRAGETDRVRVMDSPAALLLARPNRDMTSYEYKKRVFADLLLYDRHVSIIGPDADMPSGWALRPVPATWVQEYRGASPWSPEAIIVRNPNGRAIEVPRDSFVLWHGYDPSDLTRQCSPVEALADVLHEQIESNSYRRQMWTNGGRFNAYVSRPADVEQWSNEAFERFKQSWDESWAGKNATEGGKMPILEDGMQIKSVPFSAHDAEWSEAKKLGREDVAGVYNVNPALIWPGSGQTYASAKENARALYNDTLAPKLMQVVERVNADILPRIGEPDGHYVEYDLSVKLQGSFEERAAVIQSAVGGPWMTRDEARAMFNLPHIDGADELIVPLNVLEGGLASPRDTDPTVDRYSATPALKMDEHAHGCGCDACKAANASAPKRHKAAASEDDAEEMADVLRSFFKRQSKAVISKIGADPSVPDEGEPSWWDSERWDRELADDMQPVAQRQSDAHALATLADLDQDASAYSTRRTSAYIRSMCERRAQMVNSVTLRELVECITDGEDDEDARTPRDVYDVAEDSRATTGGTAFATAVAGWAALEAVRQCAPRRGATKTWDVTSGNPRPSHAAMNGETVPYGEPFSNGAMWPGDTDALAAEEVANCQCAVTIEIP